MAKHQYIVLTLLGQFFHPDHGSGDDICNVVILGQVSSNPHTHTHTPCASVGLARSCRAKKLTPLTGLGEGTVVRA